MELRTTIDDHQFKDVINNTIKHVKDLRPAMALVGQHVCESIDDTFAAEGRPDSWEALSDKTKARKNPSFKILEGESKRLREGIHVESFGHNFVDVAPDDLPYARIQHLGGEAGRGVVIPARPYLVVQESDHDRIGEIVADYILGEL